MDEPLIVNVADAPALEHPRRATIIDFEHDRESWPDTGVNIQVMAPGEPNGRYHSEPVQEDFLVLYGSCLLIIDGEERGLRQWDFVHCPAGTDHIIIGAGSGPCAVLAIGARDVDHDGPWGGYTVDEVAARHGVGVNEETSDADVAYAQFEDTEPTRYREGWLPET